MMLFLYWANQAGEGNLSAFGFSAPDVENVEMMRVSSPMEEQLTTDKRVASSNPVWRITCKTRSYKGCGAFPLPPKAPTPLKRTLDVYLIEI